MSSTKDCFEVFDNEQLAELADGIFRAATANGGIERIAEKIFAEGSVGAQLRFVQLMISAIEKSNKRKAKARAEIFSKTKEELLEQFAKIVQKGGLKEKALSYMQHTPGVRLPFNGTAENAKEVLNNAGKKKRGKRKSAPASL